MRSSCPLLLHVLIKNSSAKLYKTRQYDERLQRGTFQSATYDYSVWLLDLGMVI